MDARLLDVVTGIASILVFIVLLMALPAVLPGQVGLAYLLAFVLYIVAMGGAGYLINEKIT